MLTVPARRTDRRITAPRRHHALMFAAMTAVISVGLTACGGSPAPAAGSASDAATSVPDTTTMPTTSTGTPAAQDAPTMVGTPQAVQAAVTAFGSDGVQSSFAEMVAFSEEFTYNRAFLTGQVGQSESDYQPIEDRMTPTLATKFKTAVHSAAASDAMALQSLETLLFVNYNAAGLTYSPTGPVVADHSIGAATVSVDASTGVDRPVVTFTETGKVLALQDGKPVRVPTTRTVTYSLVRAPGTDTHHWLIDAYTGTYKFSNPEPDPGGGH